MPFTFFKKPTNVVENRKQYVKEYAVKREKVEPCEKFVACKNKLNNGYALSLSDPEETIKCAGVSVLEFNETYELKSENTLDLRENLVFLTKSAYILTNSLIVNLSEVALGKSNNRVLNDLKIDVRIMSSTMLEIYKYLSNSNAEPEMEQVEMSLKDVIDELIRVLLELIEKIDIGHIEKQLNVSVLKLFRVRYLMEEI